MQHAAGSMQSAASSREFAEYSIQQGVCRKQHAVGSTYLLMKWIMNFCFLRKKKLDTTNKVASSHLRTYDMTVLTYINFFRFSGGNINLFLMEIAHPCSHDVKNIFLL